MSGRQNLAAPDKSASLSRPALRRQGHDLDMGNAAVRIIRILAQSAGPAVAETVGTAVETGFEQHLRFLAGHQLLAAYAVELLSQAASLLGVNIGRLGLRNVSDS